MGSAKFMVIACTVSIAVVVLVSGMAHFLVGTEIGIDQYVSVLGLWATGLVFAPLILWCHKRAQQKDTARN